MELTWYGTTEKEIKKEVDEIKKRIKSSNEEIKEKQYITIEPKKKDGCTLIIPLSVMKLLEDLGDDVDKLSSKSINKCNACFGYGLHALGDSCPMGPMDASDGMPTIKCPTCGANANPYNKS